MSEDSLSQTLIYYPNPPIPLSQGFTDIVINELNFIEPFAPPLFEPLNQDEIAEFDEILKNVTGTPSIPTCMRPHKAPDFNYEHKKHLDGYPVKYEELENDSAGFQVDALTGQIGTAKIDHNKRYLYTVVDDEDGGAEQNLQKRAETEAMKRADEMAEREARNRTEEALRKTAEAKKKAEEAARLAEETRKKQEENERKRKEEENKRKALPPVLRNRFANLNILNPGGAPTSIKHMKRIVKQNKQNEAVVNRPSSEQ